MPINKNASRLLKEFQNYFPGWTITKYSLINKTTIKVWVQNWCFIFWFESPVKWSLTTLKGWEKEMKELKDEEEPFND